MSTIETYQNNLIHTASNPEILLLLLERAMQDASAAMGAMEAKDRAAWVKEIVHCRSIYGELLAALEAQAPPAITSNLRLTYTWVLHQLTQASRTGDVETIRSVLRVTATLHGAWSEVIGSVAPEFDGGVA